MCPVLLEPRNLNLNTQSTVWLYSNELQICGGFYFRVFKNLSKNSMKQKRKKINHTSWIGHRGFSVSAASVQCFSACCWHLKRESLSGLWRRNVPHVMLPRSAGRDSVQELHLRVEGPAAPCGELRGRDSVSHTQTYGQRTSEGVHQEDNRAKGILLFSYVQLKRDTYNRSFNVVSHSWHGIDFFFLTLLLFVHQPCFCSLNFKAS